MSCSGCFCAGCAGSSEIPRSFANLFELLLNAGNKITGCFADGIKTFFERFQVFVLDHVAT